MILVHRRLWIVTVEYICSTCTFLWQWWRQINIWTSPSDRYLSMWDVRTPGRATTAEVSIQHSKSITVISWAVHRLTLVRWLMIPQKYFYLDSWCKMLPIFDIFVTKTLNTCNYCLVVCGDSSHANSKQDTSRTKGFFSFKHRWMDEFLLSRCIQLLNFMFWDRYGFCLCNSLNINLITKSFLYKLIFQ